MKTAILSIIENHYNEMSPSEKTVADFFINNKNSIDFSSKNIKSLLYVSEATLSRFAKKCGYHGYREFIFDYKQTLLETNPKIDKNIENIVNTYYQLLKMISTNIDPQQIGRIVKLMETSQQVFVYGIGSSGLVAHEIKSRFMRLGLNIVSISDNELILMQSALVDETKLVIGISLSGTKKVICNALLQAKYNKAKTIFITANPQLKFKDKMDEVLIVPSLKNLNYGNIISPQFVLLVVVDILYSSYHKVDIRQKMNLLESTLKALNINLE